MNFDNTELVRAIDAEKHARQQNRDEPLLPQRTRHNLARRLHKWADRLEH